MPLLGLYLVWAPHCVGVVCVGSDLPARAKKGSLKCQLHSTFSPSLFSNDADMGFLLIPICMGGTGYPPLFFFLVHWDISGSEKQRWGDGSDKHLTLGVCLSTAFQLFHRWMPPCSCIEIESSGHFNAHFTFHQGQEWQDKGEWTKFEGGWVGC